MQGQRDSQNESWKERQAYEEARAARVKAEAKQEKQRSKQRRRDERNRFLNRTASSKKGRKALLASFVVAVAAVFIVLTVGLPLATHRPQTEYFSTATLEDIVKTSKLSTIEYVYRGIAERSPQNFLVFPVDGGYHVKYAATVKLSYDMSKVKFSEHADTITVYLPDPTNEEPVIDTESFGFMPEGYEGDLGEIVKICKEDVKSEMDKDDSLRALAEDSMQSTVRALIEPLVNSSYDIEFKQLSEYKEVAANEG